MRNQLGAFSGILMAIASGSMAQTDWLNLESYPDPLAKTGDGWSAVRIEHPSFISYRIAADDFELKERTLITRITFYSVEIGTPEIFGGDWYIYNGPAAGPPDLLRASGVNEPMEHTLIGVVNPNFGAVYENVIEPKDLVLDPGHWFLAFRTNQGYLPGGKNNNGALTTRWANSTSRGWWNFGVLADGTVTEGWVPMTQFNLVQDNEWAFRIEGVPMDVCYADCDGSGALDIDDFICFQTFFALADPYADCDGSGTLNIDDFICFQTLFAIGC
jgi:hypothetical protein